MEDWGFLFLLPSRLRGMMPEPPREQFCVALPRADVRRWRICRSGRSSHVVFYVWQDHSWVRDVHSAQGEGLSRAGVPLLVGFPPLHGCCRLGDSRLPLLTAGTTSSGSTSTISTRVQARARTRACSRSCTHVGWEKNLAVVGQMSSFTIWSRDAAAALGAQGGSRAGAGAVGVDAELSGAGSTPWDSYHVRLVGPSIVMGQLENLGDASYRVEYFIAEPGRCVCVRARACV